MGVAYIGIVQSSQASQQQALAGLEEEGAWLQGLLGQSKIQFFSCQQVNELGRGRGRGRGSRGTHNVMHSKCTASPQHKPGPG